MEDEPLSPTHVWRRFEDFRVGDTIHRWGDDLVITRIMPGEGGLHICYLDTDGETKCISAGSGTRYIARKR